MARRAATRSGGGQPRSFNGLIRRRSATVQAMARALRDIVVDELPAVQERFYGGQHAMAMYWMDADICWIQPLQTSCNIYFVRGAELSDPDQLLRGTSRRQRFAKLRSLDDIDTYPLRSWLRDTIALNRAAVANGTSVEQALERLRTICQKLPQTRETITWGKPHFRVNDKIFCGCGEDRGRPIITLKLEPYDAHVMMKLPGIDKAPYSRANDGWVSVDPNQFDDWDEIDRMVTCSYCLVAPQRLSAAVRSL